MRAAFLSLKGTERGDSAPCPSPRQPPQMSTREPQLGSSLFHACALQRREARLFGELGGWSGMRGDFDRRRRAGLGEPPVAFTALSDANSGGGEEKPRSGFFSWWLFPYVGLYRPGAAHRF